MLGGIAYFCSSRLDYNIGKKIFLFDSRRRGQYIFSTKILLLTLFPFSPIQRKNMYPLIKFVDENVK